MKKIKITAAALLCLIYVVFAGETAYFQITDKAYENFNFIYFSKVYNAEILAKDISELAEKYDCYGFFIIYDEADESHDTYCCTDGDAEKIQDILYLNEGQFNTIINGTYNIEFETIGNWADTDKIIDGFYVDGDENNVFSFYKELNQKYDCDKMGRSDYFNKAYIVGAVCIILILLLTLYDVLSLKRDVCISLTLGNSLVKEVTKNQVFDTAAFALVGIVIFVLMRKITAVSLILREYIWFIIILCVLNSLVFCLLFAVDICSTLKNNNDSSTFLPLNHALKFISTTALIILIVFAYGIRDNVQKYKAGEEFKKYFEGYSYIEVSESPSWAAEIDKRQLEKNSFSENNEISSLIEQEFEDYNTFFKCVSENSDIFLLNAFSYYDTIVSADNITNFNVVLSSDSAKSYISAQTNMEISEDKITILVPDSYMMKDLNACKKWLKNVVLKGSFEDKVEIVNYEKADIAVFGYYDYAAQYATTIKYCVLSSPIVIYIPNAAEYNFFDVQNLQSNITRQQINNILSDNNILSTAVENSSVNARAEGYMKQVLSSVIIITMVAIAVLFYNIVVVMSTMLLDIRIHRKDRAIQKILGHSFVNRYLITIIILLASIALSSYFAYSLLEYLYMNNAVLILIIALTLLFAELICLLIMGIIDERKNTVKSLKGGAL